MYLTHKNPFTVTKFPNKNDTFKVWEVLFTYFDGKTMKAYLEEYQYESLLLGRKLQQYLSDELLNELSIFVNNWGYDQYAEGRADGES